MIDKEKILKHFSEDEKEKVVKIIDKVNLASRRNIPVFTNEFFTPKIWSFFVKTNFGVKIDASGIFEEAERRILSINNEVNENYPITILKISNKSSFSNLYHKDYLGAILSLGIKREKIGDIIVDEGCGYVICMDEIADYIVYSLDSIGKSKVSISYLNKNDELPKIKFEEDVINVASMRVDNIVAKLANISRSKSIDLLNSSKVLVNYSPIKDKNLEIKEGMRITIRGVGKFIINTYIGDTKSGKKKIKIKKYC